MAPSLRHRQSESLSPRQLFQNQVRSLTTDGGDANKGHRRNKSISLKYNPYELQHVSSLRVQQYNLRSSSRSPTRNAGPALQEVREEPDFVLEERQAWSRRSPNSRTSKASPQKSEPFVVYDDGESEDDGSCGQQLRTFAPLGKSTDVNRRPQTSRGLGSETIPAGPSASDNTSDVSPARSKFMEGSMNDRSHGVASSWMNHATDYDTSASEADDDTPKALEKTPSSSIDIRDFDPPSASSVAVRRTLFRRKSNSKCLDDVQEQKRKKRQAKESEGKKSKKRLRKSLSSWSLHGLGEKMGLFNSSTNSVNNVDDENLPDSNYTPKEVLDERKRKADIAYAQQFRSKKQKDNLGTAAAVVSTGSEASKSTTIRRHPSSHDPDATIKARSTTRARRTSLKASDVTSIFRAAEPVDHDLRKRPTRRELEKENQQLREMLRRSHSNSTSHDSMRTQYNQAEPRAIAVRRDLRAQPEISDNKTIIPPPRRSSYRRSAENLQKGHTTRASSADSPGHQSLLPRPSNPNVNTLQRNRLSLDLSPRPSLPELPRPVDMIVEDPEGEESDGDRAKLALLRTRSQSSRATRRRHSMHSGDPQKTMLSEGKENTKHGLAGGIPSIVISASVDGVHDARNDWKGWDDDVF